MDKTLAANDMFSQWKCLNGFRMSFYGWHTHVRTVSSASQTNPCPKNYISVPQNSKYRKFMKIIIFFKDKKKLYNIYFRMFENFV